MTLNSGGALIIRDSDGNRLEANRVVGGGDLGIGLERATGNVLVDNVVAGTSDGGIELLLGLARQPGRAQPRRAPPATPASWSRSPIATT